MIKCSGPHCGWPSGTRSSLCRNHQSLTGAATASALIGLELNDSLRLSQVAGVLHCPDCKSSSIRVMQNKRTAIGKRIRRECDDCGARWTCMEVMMWPTLKRKGTDNG